MPASRIAAIIIALIVAAAIGAFFLWPAPPPPPPPPAAKAAPAEPTGPKYPVAQPAATLPTLADSDPTVLDALKGAIDPAVIAKLVVPESIIRNFVATVDNLTRDQVAMRLSPVHGPGGMLKTAGKDDSLAIAAANAARYTPYVDALDKTDPATIVAIYVRLYPLFQQAYVDLGFPNGYFNDRLIEVIDHLLAAPEPKAPVKLVAPHVLYEFADPDLESRSAGQKLLIRMGADNEARVKAKLREYRKQLVNAPRTNPP